jgi:hypothetical protein
VGFENELVGQTITPLAHMTLHARLTLCSRAGSQETLGIRPGPPPPGAEYAVIRVS